MANCKQCGKSVSCGCQLIDGLCTECKTSNSREKNQKVQTQQINVTFSQQTLDKLSKDVKFSNS